MIIAIVAGIALLNQGTANEQFKRQNVAVQLKNAFERARFDSVKRRAQASPSDARATVQVDTTSYSLTTYKVDSTGTATPETLTTSLSGQNIVISGNSITLPFTIYYNQRGEAVDSSGNSISPSFYVCNASCGATSDSTANLIVVTPTGTVNLLSGSSTVPTFTAPSVTTIPGNTSISNTARLP